MYINLFVVKFGLKVIKRWKGREEKVQDVLLLINGCTLSELGAHLWNDDLIRWYIKRPSRKNDTRMKGEKMITS